jgi:GDP-L-fucose synthase
VRAVRDGNEAVEVWGTGEQEREFIHVDDVVDALLLVAQHANPPDVVNVAVGDSVKIGRLAEIIAREAGFEGDIVFNDDRFVGALRRSLDPTLMRRALGWAPSVSLDAGIAATVSWYRDQLDAAAAYL